VPRFIHLQLHLLVALYATTAFFGHMITLGAVQLVFWRTLIAAVAAAIIVVALGRHTLRMPPRRAIKLLGIGAIIGMHWMCFFGAVKIANISICLAGMATASFFTAFTEPWIERRRIRPLEVLLGLMVLVGLLLVAGFERGHLLGLAIAVLGAFLAAVFPVMNRQLAAHQHMDPLVMVAWQMAGASIVCLIGVPVFHGGTFAYSGLFAWSGLDWLWLLALGLLCTVFAHGFHIHLLRHLSAYTTNLAVNFEPLYGIFAAAILLAEHRNLHPGFYLGTIAIIAANILHPLILRHLAKRKLAAARPGTAA
jgi:drug/metabolite transporter (DMT)-like permease